MSVLPSLIAALERAAGDCLILRSGERPHVMAGDVRHDVGSTILSVKAVEALTLQILSPGAQQELARHARAEEVLDAELPGGSLVARAERTGDVLLVELRRHRRPAEPAPPAPAAPVRGRRDERDGWHVVSSTASGELRPVVRDASLPAPAPAAAAEAPTAMPPAAGSDPAAEPVAGSPADHHAPRPAGTGEASATEVAAGAEHPGSGVSAEKPTPAQPEPQPAAPIHEPAAAMPDPAPANRVESAADHPLAAADSGPARPRAQAFVIEHFRPTPAEPAASTDAPRADEPPAAADTAAPDAPAMAGPGEPAARPAPRHTEPAPAANAPAGAPVVARANAASPVPGASRPAGHLDELIAEAIGRGATALYVRPGHTASGRIDERLQPLGEAVIAADDVTRFLASCAAGTDGWTAGEHGEWIRELDGGGAVRCYPISDHAGNGLVIRLSPRSSATGLLRHVPRPVRRVCETEDGLLIVAASAHADVLTMVAAVADLAARKRAGYVICIEPPTGLPHHVGGAFVSERTIAADPDAAAGAIRRAVEEAPDVLVVAAAESGGAVEQAIAAAASPGRLVVLGLVASTAVAAVQSALAAVGPEREPQVRPVLAASLRAAFGHRWLRRLGGGRTAVQDILAGTADVRARLDRGELAGLEQIQRDGADGMRSLDEALARAVARRQVSLRQAAAHAASRKDLVALARRETRARRRAARDHHPAERRQGVLRAI